VAYPGRLSRGPAWACWAWGRLVQSSPLMLIEVERLPSLNLLLWPHLLRHKTRELHLGFVSSFFSDLSFYAAVKLT
jgi:hypothetical protein